MGSGPHCRPARGRIAFAVVASSLHLNRRAVSTALGGRGVGSVDAISRRGHRAARWGIARGPSSFRRNDRWFGPPRTCVSGPNDRVVRRSGALATSSNTVGPQTSGPSAVRGLSPDFPDSGGSEGIPALRSCACRRPAPLPRFRRPRRVLRDAYPPHKSSARGATAIEALHHCQDAPVTARRMRARPLRSATSASARRPPGRPARTG